MLNEPKTRSRKRQSSTAVRRNISLPPQLDLVADSVAQKYAFPSFSDYVQGCLRRDMGIELTPWVAKTSV